MSKSERMREMQHKINSLEAEVAELRGKLTDYRKRDRPQAGDYIKVTHK